jgi:DNA-directed RNA polymerase subunit beta'
MSDIGGRIEIHRGEDGARTVKVIDSQVVRDEYPLKRGWKVLLEEDQEEVEEGAVIATRGDKELVVKTGGRLVRQEDGIVVVYDEREEREYEIPSSARLLVNEGERVKAGAQLTEGTKNPHTILTVLGRDATQEYLLQEVQKVYRSQGVNIHDKHFEVIISRMLNKVQVTACGDTEMLPGDLVDRLEFANTNARVMEEGGKPASAIPILLGVTKAALNTDSFLSAASFQHTIKVLAGAAIEGKRDELRGLKENVIIGKLIPAGTGYWEIHKDELLEAGIEPSVFLEGWAGKPAEDAALAGTESGAESGGPEGAKAGLDLTVDLDDIESIAGDVTNDLVEDVLEEGLNLETLTQSQGLDDDLADISFLIGDLDQDSSDDD